MADVDEGIRAAQEYSGSSADPANDESKSPTDTNASSSGSTTTADASSSSNSSSSSDSSSDKWSETLAVNHTLASLYLRKVEVRCVKLG
jgi:hypothetical protein